MRRDKPQQELLAGLILAYLVRLMESAGGESPPLPRESPTLVEPDGNAPGCERAKSY